MKQKVLVGSFFLAQLVDVLTTYLGIRFFHLSEENPIAAVLFRHVSMPEVMVGKLFLAAALILLYYLSQKYHYRFTFSLEKSLQIDKVATWCVVGLNITAFLLV